MDSSLWEDVGDRYTIKPPPPRRDFLNMDWTDRSAPEPSSAVQGGIRWWGGGKHHQWTRLDFELRRWDPVMLRRSEAHRIWLDPDYVPQPVVEEPAPENIPPAGPDIVTDPPAEARVGQAFVYAPRAVDPDIVGFTWFLEAGPEGMTIDRDTGALLWTPEDGGQVEVVICARSLYGRTGRQAFILRVRKPGRRTVPRANHRYQDALCRQARRRERRHFPPVYPTVRWSADWRPERFIRGASPPGGRRPAALPLRN
ncbi:MAG: Ig domain-containing protein [Planctomycetes bacterium]|nr:Ig domain-containing protein [Planctomycetota bacterium]